MEKISRLKRLLLILVGIILCVPIGAKAVEHDYQYEAGFAFYEYSYDDYPDVDDWLYDFKKKNIAEITDTSTLKAGDYVAISPTLKYIGTGNPTGIAFAMYYYYDSDVLEVASDVLSKEYAFNTTAESNKTNYGIFSSARWGEDAFKTSVVGEIDITFREKNVGNEVPFSSTTGGPFAFAMFRVKKDIADNPIKLWWITEEMIEDPSNVDENGYKLYTMGSDSDSRDVYVKTIDIIPETPKSGVKSLSSLSVVKGSDSYLNLTQDSELSPADKTFNATVPAGVASVDLSITPKHAAASVVRDTTTPVAKFARVALMAASATNTLNETLSLNTGVNTFNYTVTAEDETTETYTVNITRLSDDVTLSALSLGSDVTLSPAFVAGGSDDTFSATVPFVKNSLTITASATHSNATVSGAGAWNLTNTGATLNTKKIKVEAENCKTEYASVPGNDCTSKEYTLNVTREAASTNNYLGSLTVNPSGTNGLINLTEGHTGFVKEDENYRVELDNNVTSTVITAVADDIKAKSVVIKKGTDTITSGASTALDVGNNVYTITVTAEDDSTKVYNLTILRKSDEKGLASLTVTNGSYTYVLNPTFNPNNGDKEFETIVAPNVTSVSINATTKDSNATITGNDNPRNLTGASTELTFNVTSQNGTTDTYKVTVKRLSDVATLDNITLTDITGTFDADAKTYTATNVPYQTKSTTVSATITPNTNATIASGDGAWTFANSGATVNTKKIRVNAENCAYTTTQVPGNVCAYNEYTINVSRIAPSTDATLSNLTVSTGTLDPAFNATEHDYTVIVPNSVEAITINATANDSNATVSGDGVKNNLTVGDNNFTITVKAEDGHDGTPYKVKVVRQSNDTSLSALSVTSANGSLSPTFNKDTKTYTYTFNESVTSVTINATTTHAKASVQIGDEASSIHTATSTSINPNEANSVVVKVTAEDGTTTGGEYTINFERQKSSVNTLKRLEVKSGANTYTLSPVFVAGASPRSYTVTIPYEVDSVDIEAEATSPAATVSGNDTGIAVGFEDVVKTVTVHPEEGSDGVYTITIKRTKSDEARLTDIRVNGTSITGFNENTLSYTLDDVGSSVEDLTIDVDKKEEHANVVISGNTGLTEGENTITITVTPQNGDTAKNKVYTLKVTKTSNDATLDSLVITDNSTTGTGSLVKNDDDTYTYTYPKDATIANIVATNSHGGTPSNDGEVTLSDGLVHTVSITSQEGTTKNYQITFNKIKEHDSTLSSLSVMGDKEYVTDFSPAKVSYSYKVPSDVNKVTINATANGTYAKNVEISNANENGEVDLTSGINTITVKVTAEDDTTTTYTISIEREINQNATLIDLKVKDGATELTLTPSFVSSTTNYNVEVGYDVTSVNIEATATTGATINPDDLGSKTLDTVGDNTFVIHVTAEDGNTTGSYTVVVHRKSNDTSLSDLQASVGTLTKDNDTNYTLEVSDKESSVTITPSLSQGDASVTNREQLNNINLNTITDNKIEFEVVAEDNNYKETYTINVVKLSSDASINDLTVRHRVDGETSTANVVTPTGNTYRVTVPYGTDQVIVDTSVHDGTATIDTAMPITHDLSDGNTISFKVTAEDGTEANYQVIVTVDPNSNANLGDDGIKVFGKPAVWNETQKYYEVTVDSTEVDLTPSDVEVSKSDSNATISKGSAMELAPDTPNDYTVTITAANGTTTKNYPIKITRPASTDNSLNSVTSTVGDITEKDGGYVITVPVGTENFTVAATPTFKKANVTSGTGVKNVSDGDFNIEVTSEAGDTATYQVKVETLGLSNDGENAGLSVEGYTLNPEFNSSTKAYNLNKNVEANVNNLTVLAHATGDVKITYALDNGEFGDNNVIDVSGKTGTGSIKVKITSNISGKEDVYTIGFNKLEKTGISALSVTDYNFKETFAEETYNYTIDGDVAHDTNSLTVNVTTVGSVVVRYQLDEQAQSTNNVIDVSSIVGAHAIKVIVTPNNGGEVKTYNIAFNKDSGETEKITSSIHNVEEIYVWDNRTEVNVATYITEFDNDASSLHVYRSDGTTEVTSGNVGTGMIIKLIKDGNVLDQKTIALLGDTNGDGEITMNDAAKITSHYLGNTTLEGAFLVVADTNGDSDITMNDASKITSHYLGNIDLYEKKVG